jgi:hypothetical protein
LTFRELRFCLLETRRRDGVVFRILHARFFGSRPTPLTWLGWTRPRVGPGALMMNPFEATSPRTGLFFIFHARAEPEVFQACGASAQTAATGAHAIMPGRDCPPRPSLCACRFSSVVPCALAERTGKRIAIHMSCAFRPSRCERPA